MLNMIQKLICYQQDPEPYDKWDDAIIEDLHRKAQKKNKSDKER